MTTSCPCVVIWQLNKCHVQHPSVDAQGIMRMESKLPQAKVKSNSKAQEKAERKVYLPHKSTYLSQTPRSPHLPPSKHPSVHDSQAADPHHQSMLADNALTSPPQFFGDGPKNNQQSQQTTFLICFLSSPSAEGHIQGPQGTQAKRQR